MASDSPDSTRKALNSDLTAGEEWVLDVLWGDSKVHLTTSETAMESAIEKYGVDGLDEVISELDLLLLSCGSLVFVSVHGNGRN